MSKLIKVSLVVCELSGDKAAVFSLGVQLLSVVLKENIFFR